MRKRQDLERREQTDRVCALNVLPPVLLPLQTTAVVRRVCTARSGAYNLHHHSLYL